MTEVHIALFFHLIGAFSLVAGLVVADVAFETARRRRTPSEIALLLGLSRIGVILVGVGVVLTLAFGLWLVHLGSWGNAGWVDAAFVMLIIIAAVGALAGQRPKRARQLASELAVKDEAVSSELRALLSDRATLAANYLSAGLLLAIIVLMVFKPGGHH